MDWDKVSVDLRKKLDPKHVVEPKDRFGPKGSYVEGWLIIDEANRIFGFGEWSYEVRAVTCVAERPKEIGRDKKPGFGVTYTAHVRVTVGGVVREDFGAGHGHDVDLGLAHESAIKESVTDSLKRCLRTFGNPFGLALYDKTRENVGVDLPPPPPFNPQATRNALIHAIEAASSADVLDKIKADPAFRADYDRLAAADKKLAAEVVKAGGVKRLEFGGVKVPMPHGMNVPGAFA